MEKLINGELLDIDEAYANHKGLILKEVRRFQERGEQMGHDMDDLWNMGAIGFTLAFKRFDDTKGLRFSTYAVPTIRFTISNELSRQTGRFSYTQRIQEYAQQYKIKGNEEVTVPLIMKHLEIPYHKAYEVFCYILNPVPISLEKRLKNGNRLFLVGDVYGYEDDFSTPFIDDIKSILNEREREVLEYMAQGYKSPEIKEFMGCTQSWVNEIKRDIKKKVKTLLKQEEPELAAAL